MTHIETGSASRLTHQKSEVENLDEGSEGRGDAIPIILSGSVLDADGGSISDAD